MGEVALQGTGPLVVLGDYHPVVARAGDELGLVEVIGQLDRADADGRILSRVLTL